MSLVKLKDKRTGVTYVYESESYWDKEKKQPRSHRKLIGKVDDATGEIIPTGKSGRKRGTSPDDLTDAQNESISEYLHVIEEKDEQLRQLKAEVRMLHKEKQDILKALDTLYRKYSTTE